LSAAPPLQTGELSGRRTARRAAPKGNLAIRDGEWKYIEGRPHPKVPAKSLAATAGEYRPQLYRLADDPGEQRDLVAERSEVARRLTDLLAAQRARPHDRLRRGEDFRAPPEPFPRRGGEAHAAPGVTQLEQPIPRQSFRGGSRRRPEGQAGPGEPQDGTEPVPPPAVATTAEVSKTRVHGKQRDRPQRLIADTVPPAMNFGKIKFGWTGRVPSRASLSINRDNRAPRAALSYW